jgi:alkylated DNA nucleotide flippase Atl1
VVRSDGRLLRGRETEQTLLLAAEGVAVADGRVAPVRSRR